MIRNKRNGRERDYFDRRRFLQGSAAAIMATFIPGISSAEPIVYRPDSRKRLVIMFSPNGMVKQGFWPKNPGPDFELTSVLEPLADLRESTLVVHGICNKVKGDGDSHMRGMSCLLTSNELFPGNIQGGGHTPAGWAKGISIDQEIKTYLQSNSQTKTRFGSLEFGVRVPNEANPWTRMVYGGPNQPIAPISDPYQMFAKMYGDRKGKENLQSVLGLLQQDMLQTQPRVAASDRRIFDAHQSYVEQFKSDLETQRQIQLNVEPTRLPDNVENHNDNMPELSKMQIDLLVNGFANDLCRVATLQYSKSVGNDKMKWLDVSEGHHGLSHNPDDDKATQEKLVRINRWYCEQLAYLAQQLKATIDPQTNRPMLDDTLILWTNELGHGNSHSLNNLPMVMIGGGFGFDMGRYVKVKKVSTDRLWLAIAHAMGHHIESFGKPNLSNGKALSLT